MKLESIYIVDDDEISNFNNTHLIEKLNVTGKIIVKKGAREALQNLEHTEMSGYSLILLDLMMPVIDGFEFIRKFKKMVIPNKENIKIAILTHYDSDFNSSRLNRMGNYPIISKPLTHEKLNNVLKNICGT